MRAVRSMVAAAAVVASFAAAAPAHAWECQRSEVCQQAVMTVCTTVAKVTGEHNCH
ncbi:MAG TPA: hypothetical protein VG318_19135 [Actinomycetota bacterium]|nr:hypothetical protein [Actinomycetota bacterium]